MDSAPLRIAQWNANGLQNHKEELTIFLKQNYIDILLISETHFTYKKYFRIPNYKLCHTTHPDRTAHGGTAKLIKESIQHYELLKYREESIQATSIKVRGFPHEITVTAAYCPPKHNLKKEQFQTFFQTLRPRFIAGGRLQQQTHRMWLKNNDYKRKRITKGHTGIKLNSVALVRERTIPTERPPPVGEVSANFCG